MDILKNKNIIIFAIVLLSTILICTLPMKLSPVWNGENPGHHNQYELLADSILKGHLYIDYNDIDEKLLEMENPYDPQKRDELNVKYHWDHAFYNGKYYVYFGIAPVILTFIPYKIITGKTLSTLIVTQIYTAIFIIGMFLLLYDIYKYLLKDIKLSVYLFLASSLSILSVWICVGRPALYCTAIISGLCMAIWSLYFYFKSVYGHNDLNKSIILATTGGLFGALTFACRPPIGFVNILAIPLLITFFKKYGFNKKVISKVLIAFAPYIIIGSLLMIYNYIRFDNVFEFGQSYQLTVADQHNYLNITSRLNLTQIKTWLLYNFFEIKSLNSVFPYINISGAFINFPVFVLPYILIIDKNFRENLTSKKIKGLYITLMILPFLVTIFDIIASPFLTDRYRLDIYYLLAILTFISVINFYSIYNDKTIKRIIIVISLLIIITCILLFFVPCDSNFTDYYKSINPRINEIINNFLKKLLN